MTLKILFHYFDQVQRRDAAGHCHKSSEDAPGQDATDGDSPLAALQDTSDNSPLSLSPGDENHLSDFIDTYGSNLSIDNRTLLKAKATQGGSFLLENTADLTAIQQQAQRRQAAADALKASLRPGQTNWASAWWI